MDYGRYVGRVGALAVALGIGVAVANGGVAQASPESASGDTDNPGATPSASPGSSSDTAGSTAPDPSDPPETKVGTEEVEKNGIQDTITRIRTRAQTVLLDALDGDNVATRGPKGTAQPADRPLARQRANAQDDPTSGGTVNQLTAPSQKNPGQQASTGTAALQRTLRAVTAPPQRNAAPTPNATKVASAVDTLTTGTETQLATTTAAVSLPPEAAVDQPSARVAMGLLSFVGLQPGAPTPAAPVAPAGSLLEFLGGALRRIDRALFNKAPQESVLVEDPNEVTGVVNGRVATDPDNALEFSLTDPPDHGTVEFNPDGTFTYTPDYTEVHPVGQTDTFTVEVSEANTLHLHPAGGDHTITVSATVDVAPNLTVIDTVEVGNDAIDLAVTPDGTRLYVANFSSNTVSVIDTSTNSVIGSIPITTGTEPSNIAINPEGTRAYVVVDVPDDVEGFPDDTDGVAVINIEPGTPGYNTVIATVPVGEAAGEVAVSRDGSRAYVTSFFDDTVTVIDGNDNSVIDTVSFASDEDPTISEDGLGHMEFSPTEDIAYISDIDDAEVLVVDANPASATYMTVIRRVSIAGTTDPTDPGTAQGLAVSEDGNRVYAVNNEYGTVWVIDTTDPANAVAVATIDAGIEPDLFLDSITVKGNRVFVNQWNFDRVIVIDTETNTVIELIPIAQHTTSPSEGPWAVAFSPDGTRLYVANVDPSNVLDEDGNIPENNNDVVSVVAVLQEA